MSRGTGNEELDAPTCAPRGSHEAFAANLKPYLDGELSRAHAAVIRWHIGRCPACREEMEWLKRLGIDARHLDSATPRPELRARILASLPDGPLERTAVVVRRQSPSFALASRVAAAGALCVLALAAAVALRGINTTAVLGDAGTSAGTRSNVRNYAAAGSVRAPGLAPAQAHNEPVQSSRAVAASADIKPDPTSERADEIVAAEEREEARQEAAIQAMAARDARQTQPASGNQPSAVAAVRVLPTAPPIRLAMAVSSIEAERAALTPWIAQAGGRIAPEVGGSGAAPASATRAHGGSQAMRDTAGDRAATSIIVCSVPLVRAAAIVRQLRIAGAIDMAPSGTMSRANGKPLPPHKGMLPRAVAEPYIGPDGPTTVRPLALRGSAGDASHRVQQPAPAFTRLVIELRRAPAAPASQGAGRF